ncbi:MAG TPA: anthranilate phosphoribosyltransferase, partial [Tepidisphaeraceae bacterium]|nr:anthranilate phosphoribosyltransferase [Tepidisphaeraceae bacterium]
VDCGTAAGGVILDTCGTGGSVLRRGGMFNVSTASALIAAGAGVKVVKHGNRSASSKAGSADVLEKLGVRLEATPRQMTQCLETAGLCFAFARSHHPAMKFVAPVRTALGIPTIFNLLGPLTNPAKARHQVLGVFAPELTGKLAQVLRDLGSERAWVVYAEDGLDELSTLGPSRVGELKDGHVTNWTLDPKSLGLEYGRLGDLQVANVDEAAVAMRAVLAGEKGPRRDIAVLNAAAALVVAGRVKELREGLTVAAESLNSGRARQALETLVRESNA